MRWLIFIVLLLVLLVLVFAAISSNNKFSLSSENLLSQITEAVTPLPPLPKYETIHAIYLTAGTAESDRMEKIIKLVKRSMSESAPELVLNAAIIDVQDAQGNFLLDSEIKTVVRRLRFLKIFPIARIVVFQNNQYAQAHPDQTFKFASSEEANLYRDEGGRHWLDPADQRNWEYIWSLTKQAAAAGFGEINFDYIRYPEKGQREIIQQFSIWIKDKLKAEYPEAQLTADLFGYTFLRERDIGVGQDAAELAKIFDFIYPMIYPSHYDPGNFGFDNPADHPYEVMFKTLEQRPDIKNVRPWIQDFNLGAIYTPEMVRAQMKAITDFGLNHGWLIWNPNNKYREEIFN